MWDQSKKKQERELVLDLIGRWNGAIARVDHATNAAKLAMAEHPEGMGSMAFEEARRTAVRVLDSVRSQTSSPRFWPILQDDRGAVTMLALRQKVEEANAHQLNLLRLWGIAALAIRRGREEQLPTAQEMAAANRDFGRVLDEIGKVGGKLLRHYGASLQEVQAATLAACRDQSAAASDAVDAADASWHANEESLDNLVWTIVTFTLAVSEAIHTAWADVTGERLAYPADMGIRGAILHFLLYMATRYAACFGDLEVSGRLQERIVVPATEALIDASFAPSGGRQSADVPSRDRFVEYLVDSYNYAVEEYSRCADVPTNDWSSGILAEDGSARKKSFVEMTLAALGTSEGPSMIQGTIPGILVESIVLVGSPRNPAHKTLLTAQVWILALECLAKSGIKEQVAAICQQ